MWKYIYFALVVVVRGKTDGIMRCIVYQVCVHMSAFIRACERVISYDGQEAGINTAIGVYDSIMLLLSSHDSSSISNMICDDVCSMISLN